MGINADPKSKYAAEFIGTFMLVFTVGLTQSVGQTGGESTQIFGPTSIACVLMVMVYALGPISGGHFNPAVTFAALLQEKIEKKDAGIYMIAQLVAGFAAAMATGGLYGFGGSKVGPQNTHVYHGAWVGAPIIEFLYTFMLCFVVLNCCMTKKVEAEGKPPTFFGIAIGFVIIAGGYGGGTVSGGCFNPAVALGVNFMAPSWKFFYLPIYMACEMAGGFMAVTIFQLIRKECKVEAFNHYGKLQQICDKIESKFDPEDTTELIGTFLLTLTWALNGLAAESHLPCSPAGVWSIAACLMSLIYATGDISGGLFNPALTVATLGRYYGTKQGIGQPNSTGIYDRLCDPKESAKEGPKYLIAQMLGGAAGAATSFVATFTWPPGAAIGPGTKANGDHYNLGQAFFAEFFGTFLLAFVVLSVAMVKKPLKEYAAFAIGGCIVAGGYGFAPLSGGVLNPAIAIANGILQMSLFTTPAPALYIFAELLGGVAATAVFKFLTHPHEYLEIEDAGYLIPPTSSNEEAPRRG